MKITIKADTNEIAKLINLPEIDCFLNVGKIATRDIERIKEDFLTTDVGGRGHRIKHIDRDEAVHAMKNFCKKIEISRIKNAMGMPDYKLSQIIDLFGEDEIDKEGT